MPSRPQRVTLRLTDEEHAALRERAEAEHLSVPDAIRRAISEYIDHRDRVSAAAMQ